MPTPATVTFSDGVDPDGGHRAWATPGATTVDLSSLADGPITATIHADDAASNGASGTGDSLTKDTTADADTNLAVTINDGDGFINNSEQGAVG